MKVLWAETSLKEKGEISKAKQIHPPRKADRRDRSVIKRTVGLGARPRKTRGYTASPQQQKEAESLSPRCLALIFL